MPATERRERLRQLLRELSLLNGDQFQLASGRTSSVFFNLKTIMLDPEGINLIADEILARLAGDSVDFIGGIAVGAVPIVAAVCVKSYPARPLRAFYVRAERKDHGTERQIEGHIADGARVVVLDDVTTTGGSVMRAVRAAQARGCTVVKVMTVVDRQEGAVENLAADGLSLEALFTKDELLD
jgi:orotate phosphoribosyltransferase